MLRYAPEFGVNNRDLKTFTTSAFRQRTARPARAQKDTLLVGEGGIKTPHADSQPGSNAQGGVRTFLVGESLMRLPDIAAATRQPARRLNLITIAALNQIAGCPTMANSGKTPGYDRANALPAHAPFAHWRPGGFSSPEQCLMCLQHAGSESFCGLQDERKRFPTHPSRRQWRRAPMVDVGWQACDTAPRRLLPGSSSCRLTPWRQFAQAMRPRAMCWARRASPGSWPPNVPAI